MDEPEVIPPGNRMEMVKAEAPQGLALAWETDAATAQIRRLQQYIDDHLKDGSDFGKIPGCGDKPALFKSGAEKLAFLYGVYPDFIMDAIDEELLTGHAYYRIKCVLHTLGSERRVGTGVGSCSTRETRYAYRWVQEWHKPHKGPRPAPEHPMAKAGWEPFYVGKQKVWHWKRRQEHENHWDNRNTVLKMAKKRAYVDAVLTLARISELFTQDIEEQAPEAPAAPAPAAPAEEPSPVQPELPKETPKRKPRKKAAEKPPTEAELRVKLIEHIKSRWDKVEISTDKRKAMAEAFSSGKTNSKGEALDLDCRAWETVHLRDFADYVDMECAKIGEPVKEGDPFAE